jgi:hypothetical protein
MGKKLVIKKKRPSPPPFEPPVAYSLICPSSEPLDGIKDKILVLIFATASHLQESLGRPHLAYDKEPLKGPLRGINFPAASYSSWMSCLVSESSEDDVNLSPQESCVAALVSAVNPIYILASIKGDQSTLYHEWAHAMYFVSEEVRDLASELYSGLELPLKKIVDHDLRMRGYQESVFVDEFQAYLLESPSDFGSKWAGRLRPGHEALRKLIPRPVLQEPFVLDSAPTLGLESLVLEDKN